MSLSPCAAALYRLCKYHSHNILNRQSSPYLVIVIRIASAAAPCPHANIGLAIRKGADQLVQGRMILDGIDPDHLPRPVEVDARLQGLFHLGVRFLPRLVELLHEERVSLARPGLAGLLHGQVAPGPDDVAEVDEVVA